MENSFQVLVIIGSRETCLKGTVSLSHVGHLHVFWQWHCVGVLNTRQRNLSAWCRCRVFPILHKKTKKLLTFLLLTQSWVFLPSHCLSPFLTSGKEREKEKYCYCVKKNTHIQHTNMQVRWLYKAGVSKLFFYKSAILIENHPAATNPCRLSLKHKHYASFLHFFFFF